MAAISPTDQRPADLLATAALFARPSRAPDLATEVEAFRELSLLIATDPEHAIQHFAELAVSLCRAGSAGVSLLTDGDKGEPIFRWDVLAGAFAPYAGGTTPRHFSPCGLCLDQGKTILVSRPARVFHYLNTAEPAITEGLIVPVRDAAGDPVGTIWVLHHGDDAGFDAEDARVMEDLAVQLTLALELRREAAERRAAAQEVHHRVKNTLMAAVSTLRLQARETPSPEAQHALEEALNRLGAMASAHEVLYRAAAISGEVEVAPLLDRCVEALRQSGFCEDGRVELRATAEPDIRLPSSAAVPLALLANEAVTNACKHAFADDRRGLVEVRLERQPENAALVLTVRDTGVGLSNQVQENGLGLKLIRAFARQVGGSLTISGEGGTTISLVLRTPPAEAGTVGE